MEKVPPVVYLMVNKNTGGPQMFDYFILISTLPNYSLY
jgi:hypothetical protein